MRAWSSSLFLIYLSFLLKAHNIVNTMMGKLVRCCHFFKGECCTLLVQNPRPGKYLYRPYLDYWVKSPFFYPEPSKF